MPILNYMLFLLNHCVISANSDTVMVAVLLVPVAIALIIQETLSTGGSKEGAHTRGLCASKAHGSRGPKGARETKEPV